MTKCGGGPADRSSRRRRPRTRDPAAIATPRFAGTFAATTPPIKAPTVMLSEIRLVSFTAIRIPAGSGFQVEANSRHGEVESDFSGPNLKITTEGDNPSIAGTVGKGGPLIHLSTAYGTIRLLRSEGGSPSEPGHPPSAPKTPPGSAAETARLLHHPFPAVAFVSPPAVCPLGDAGHFRRFLARVISGSVAAAVSKSISRSVVAAVPPRDRDNGNWCLPSGYAHSRLFDIQ